jgi:hypothetical protein
MPAPTYIQPGTTVVVYKTKIKDNITRLVLVPESEEADWVKSFDDLNMSTGIEHNRSGRYLVNQRVEQYAEGQLFTDPTTLDWLTINEVVSRGYMTKLRTTTSRN